MVGLVFQSALLRVALDKPYAGGFAGTIFAEFSIGKDELKAIMEQGILFWKNFSQVILILENKKAFPKALHD